MKFNQFATLVNEHFQEMARGSTVIYDVRYDNDTLWEKYLESFPPGKNEIYITRREYDCSFCRHFIKQFGGVVSVKNGVVESIWDISPVDDTFSVVAKAMSEYIHSLPISDVHLETGSRVGVVRSLATDVNGEEIKFNHFFVDIPNHLRVSRLGLRSVEEVKGQYRDSKNVFKRSLEEISVDSIDTVLELISSNTLYRGAEWKNVLEQFRDKKAAYDGLGDDRAKDIFAWEQSALAGVSMSRIRNHSIGTLLVNISNGVPLDDAVSQYEHIVAPSNYKRPKAVFTKKMVEEAQKTISELGYMESLGRRHATLDDITVNNVLFSDKDSAKRMAGAANVFDDMMKDATPSPKKFSKVEEISAQSFIDDVLPQCSGVDVYIENKHAGNMVSLIAPAVASSKTMFKWNNNFSWAYSGNMADSMLKERVKAAGGDVTGDLRFSIQWNDIDTGRDNNDLDAHCVLPNKRRGKRESSEIYFAHKREGGGVLDVDITHPGKNVAVENITFQSRKNMADGVYRFLVNQYSNRGGRRGFRAEIEFDGVIRSYNYDRELRQNEDVVVAEVELRDGQFTIKEMLPSVASSKEMWGVNTNEFVPVSVICYSPNHWDGQNGIGSNHLFFMLKDCVNPENPNGFFNEFLKEDLLKHKRVFEALGAKMKVESSDDQLSGVGFCLTKRNDLIVRVKGNVERIMKIKF